MGYVPASYVSVMETEGKETPAKSRIQWAQVVITALITSLFSIVVGVLLFNFTNREPRITYEIFPTSSFSGETQELIIQNIRIQNEGDKEAEKVQVVVSFPTSTKISDTNFEASSLALEVNSVPDTSEFKRAYEVPMLNQNEYIRFSFLVENYSGQGIDVAVRGTGVSGVLKEVSNDTRTSMTDIIFTIIIAALSVLLLGILGFTMAQYLQLREEKEEIARTLQEVREWVKKELQEPE